MMVERTVLHWAAMKDDPSAAGWVYLKAATTAALKAYKTAERMA